MPSSHCMRYSFPPLVEVRDSRIFLGNTSSNKFPAEGLQSQRALSVAIRLCHCQLRWQSDEHPRIHATTSCHFDSCITIEGQPEPAALKAEGKSQRL